jgi:intraflagellar transport protein 88
MTADRYNPAALINKGNTVFVKKDYEKAAEFYKEALRNDSSCTEALYNLGKLNRQSLIQEDHCWEFRDLSTLLLLIMYSSLPILTVCPFSLGLTYKRLGRLEESLDCFLKLHAILRNSAQVMWQLANLYPHRILGH